MLFNSFQFFVFFSTFLVLYFSTPRGARPVLLLIASYIFYAGWRPSFLILLLFTTFVDYFSALAIDTAKSAVVRRAALFTSLTINFGLLGTFKYLDFLLSNIVGAAGFFGVELPPLALNLILPVGISFYTFQSVGYTLDVYNRRFPAERNLLYYAVYVAFFPQLVAGPIERASHMIAQYKAQRPTSPERIATGLWLVGWGLFKKMCIADIAAPFVNGVFTNPTSFNGSYTFIAVFLFALQIYCDFSGYSDIAIGIARIMGIDLMINFRQPYFATSLTDFWRRWHISLSTWFRDYLYVPLGGNRTTRPAWVRNMLVVFGVSGLWHGANWTFLIWGLWHGTALVLEDVVRRSRRLSPVAAAVGAAPAPLTATNVSSAGLAGAAAGLVYTLAAVLIGWVFFRARSFHDAIYILKSWTHFGPVSYGTFKILGLSSVELLLLVSHIIVLVIVDGLIANRPGLLRSARAGWILPMFGALVLFYDIMLFGAFGSNDFIYFQF
ncbi:MBOAT family O-acyltransferase [Methylocapsa palsarum]|uniref:Probable alginate O-acetylase AlgI n=1 Tax=Methylocapsa palsarum TaxID=1612308 RepID=A0A1I3X1U9_9HYPH|nr:MBOAT family O-acyltransferase [Methylocapsa palsarum]SFK13624.1 D-alanyl-lipoteichoic acid acyltransferase DltB, MBOAT superfamily [Methylocapsa palsarum]